MSSCHQQDDSLKKDDILTRDQSHWRCVHEHESAPRKWFYFYLNGRTVNNQNRNYIFKIILLWLYYGISRLQTQRWKSATRFVESPYFTEWFNVLSIDKKGKFTNFRIPGSMCFTLISFYIIVKLLSNIPASNLKSKSLCYCSNIVLFHMTFISFMRFW